MSGDFSGLLNTALTIVAIATLAGLGLLRGTVTNLREQLADERAARAADRQQRADDERESALFKTNAETRIASLESDALALQRVVTGEIHWIALGERLEDVITILTALRDFLMRGKP